MRDSRFLGGVGFSKSGLPILFCVILVLASVGFSHAAVIEVTTAADEFSDPGPDGGCSLREAIQAANTDGAYGGCGAGSGTDTINLPGGTYTLSITGASEDSNATGDLDINSAIIIQGAGAGSTTLDGDSIDRVFHVFSTDVEIHDITITGGRAPDSEDGEPFQNVENGEGGGGICVDSGAVLTIADSTISGNRSGDGGDASYREPGGGGDGGGISNLGTLQISGSTINGNTAGDGGIDTEGQEDPGEGGRGGGIYSDDNSMLILVNSTVTGNHSGNGGDGYGAGYGGGIFCNSTAEAAFTNTTISQNATGTDGTYGSGGGIFSYGTMDIAYSTISSNQSCYGGGINTSWSDISIANSTISGNTALGPGGGLNINSSNGNHVKLTHSTVTNNTTVSGNGGGVYSYGYPSGQLAMELKNSIISGNVDNGGQNNDCRRDNSGIYTSHNYNLVGSAGQCQASESNDQETTNPMLDALADNGGPTQTHALQQYSPAIDNGACADIDSNVVSEDQRGDIRPYPGGSDCDIGAFELNRFPCSRPEWDEGCTFFENFGCPQSKYCDNDYDETQYLCTAVLGCTSLDDNSKSWCSAEIVTPCGIGVETGKPHCYCDSEGDCSCHADAKITLLDFDALRQDGGVRLAWRTGSELSCGVFEIMRCERNSYMSTAEPNCAPADHVELDLTTLCEGNPGGADYEAFDADVSAGASYSYYLREVDFTGSQNDYGPAIVPMDFHGIKAAEDDENDSPCENEDKESDETGNTAGDDDESDDAGAGCGF